ncbi:pseudouridine synthase [Sporomusa sphaeroides]|jgi:23S rRNA pseudouridine2605 synthase|uniref:Pseudouridine synthase n=2 Tax=Sporomusa TaxID=2375 RepID=A0ABM9VYF2_9FIRM|nr:pseudouridine synthase [Sporomusa sphaeroides]MCM0760062.1 rRNA pseudouridine synthase [Sporomusa sphaeroides DSM 2875]OLS58315.1 ribosomal large subunit pseudouridine synthase B [Sporomusa sphaeroides DSM 2875]CVK17498.1 Ribosomal large subunit pseudouridine synthase B [Sporomusa sphaeroides DSM 2875]SCM80327.1 Ribosomal large subunit pseudouridine synthase B [uncultured Sporomusa sp.]HML31622.1 pseudouridine synthase [Sporomusa sphaeroides]
MLERLQKVIAQAGIASRRDAEELITAGRVTVNGKTVTELGSKVETRRDRVAVDGKPLKAEKYVYILLNKPKGIITALEDPRGRKTVATLVADIPERVYPVGRLDYNTEGLLLMTNDGDLTHALTHPSHEIAKTYLVKVQGYPPEEKLDKLRAGIKLEDGMTAPAKINIVDIDREKALTTMEFVIYEGKNRQIRRMCEAIGFPVKNLKRVKFAFLTLEGVRRGQYRQLLAGEVEELKRLGKKKNS